MNGNEADLYQDSKDKVFMGKGHKVQHWRGGYNKKQRERREIIIKKRFTRLCLVGMSY